MYSLSEDWERRGEGKGRGGRQRGGLVQYFYGFFKMIFYFLFIFLALKIPEGISLLFMPRLFKKKKKKNQQQQELLKILLLVKSFSSS